MKSKLKIEYVDIEKLKPYPNNAKLHPAEQIEQIKSSVEAFGFNDPIAVWKNNEVIEGHGRLLAVKELGWDKVPIIRLDSLSDDERKAYMLAHNQLTMNTGFDIELLDIELEDIEIDMEQFGIMATDIDWDSIEDLSDESYEEPTHNMLECPKCHHIDRDIHFKKIQGVEEEQKNTDD